VTTTAVTEIVLDIPGTPPSFNAVGLHSHWTVGRAQKKKWQRFCEVALMAAAAPRGLDSVLASGRLEFTQRRRRDEGNFRVILEKALGDALVNGGWISDDTPEHYSFGAVEIVAPARRPRTLVTLAFST
jgi:hypothetical protein